MHAGMYHNLWHIYVFGIFMLISFASRDAARCVSASTDVRRVLVLNDQTSSVLPKKEMKIMESIKRL